MTDLNQSVTDPVANTTGAGYQEASVSQNPRNATEDPRKVAVFGLAFATTEEELKSAFSTIGTVAHAQIITRGTRSLGYGFVTFSTEDEAKKAVETMNDKELAGRQIKVQHAKPKAVTDAAKAEKSKSRTRSRSNAKGSSRAPRRARADEGEEDGAEVAADQAADNQDAEKQANGSGPSKNAKRKQKKKAAAAAAAAAADQGADKEQNGNAPATETNGSSDSKPKRAPRQRKGPPQGEPSKTLVFVSGLNFDTTNDKLKEAFSDYKLKSAHVVKRRFGDKNKNKGFAFVDFEDEHEQQRAIASATGKEIDGFPIRLKVAIQGEKEKAQAEAIAEAEATSAQA